MKVSLSRCIEPVEVEVLDAAGEVADTLSFEASFTDANVLQAAALMRDMVASERRVAERFAGIPASEVGEREASEAVEAVTGSMRPLIDLLLGDGAAEQVAEAVGGAGGASGCVTAMASLWSGLAMEVARRARPMKEARAERYMDARP